METPKPTHTDLPLPASLPLPLARLVIAMAGIVLFIDSIGASVEYVWRQDPSAEPRSGVFAVLPDDLWHRILGGILGESEFYRAALCVGCFWLLFNRTPRLFRNLWRAVT